ncbi:hypothetical protein D3C76_998420 [compost metagenome]
MSAGRQQTTVAVGRAGVEFEAEHAQCINTKSYSAFGVAGLHIENKALGPLFAFRGSLTGTGMTITEVTVEVDVACFDFGAAVFKKTSGLSRYSSKHREQADKAAPGRERVWGKHEKRNPKERQKTTGAGPGADNAPSADGSRR